MLTSGNDPLLFPPSNIGVTASPSRPASGSAAVSISDTTAATSRSASTTGYNTMEDTLTDPALVDPHVAYYFESVVNMQYVFGTDAARKVLREVSAVFLGVNLIDC